MHSIYIHQMLTSSHTLPPPPLPRTVTLSLPMVREEKRRTYTVQIFVNRLVLTRRGKTAAQENQNAAMSNPQHSACHSTHGLLNPPPPFTMSHSSPRPSITNTQTQPRLPRTLDPRRSFMKAAEDAVHLHLTYTFVLI